MWHDDWNVYSNLFHLFLPFILVTLLSKPYGYCDLPLVYVQGRCISQTRPKNRPATYQSLNNSQSWELATGDTKIAHTTTSNLPYFPMCIVKRTYLIDNHARNQRNTGESTVNLYLQLPSYSQLVRSARLVMVVVVDNL
jgi:hypothetical protein